MPITKLTFRPGINTELSQTANEGGWSAGQLVRFRYGMPEKWRGWQTLCSTPTVGGARAILTWIQTNSQQNLAVGTNSNLYICTGSSLYDITPAGYVAGPQDGSFTFGVGSGPVGMGLVGTSPSYGLLGDNRPASWSLDNWGEILLACARYGKLYQWLPSGGVTVHATEVTNGSDGPPLVCEYAFVAMPERHAVILGTSDLAAGTNFNPMQLRWSDVDNYTMFRSTPTNSAGKFVLQGGNRLLSGLNVSGQTTLWSDECIFSMQFLGNDLVYGFNRLGSGCGIISPRARVEHGGVIYYMGINAIFSFQGGAPVEIPCPVWLSIFPNINRAQADKISCGLNAAADSVVWFYPSLATQDATPAENDSYLEYNFIDGVFAFGLLNRSVWVDSIVFCFPISVDSQSGLIYQQEVGYDAAGLPMQASITGGYMDIGDGTDIMYIDRIFPDFNEQVGDVYVTMTLRQSANDPAQISKTAAFAPTDDYKTTRARGRQVAFTFSTLDLGAFFRLGAVRVQASPDGRRP